MARKSAELQFKEIYPNATISEYNYINNWGGDKVKEFHIKCDRESNMVYAKGGSRSNAWNNALKLYKEYHDTSVED